MRKIVCLMPLMLLAACEAEVKAPAAAAAERVKMEANADGRVAFDLPFAKGEIKLPAGLMANSQFDIGGVGMMPGAQITGVNIDAGQGEPGKVNLTFNAPTDPQAVKDWFLKEFRAQSVEAALVADAIQGTTRDGSKFLMRFAPQGTGTSGTIEIDSGK